MQLKNTNCRTLRNLQTIQDALAAFPGEDVIVLEYFSGLNHLIWTKGTEGYLESISVPIPTAWLEESALEA
jgi:hypothetical protein